MLLSVKCLFSAGLMLMFVVGRGLKTAQCGAVLAGFYQVIRFTR